MWHTACLVQDKSERVRIDRQIESVAALGEPLRRSLYLYVAEQDTDVSREDAAAALGIARPLAAFHLDKLC